jgi:hypothetical protein
VPTVPRSAVPFALIVTAVLLTGCGASAASSARPASSSAADLATDTTAGGPFPHQLDGETYPGKRAPVTGRVVLRDNGCLLVTAEGVSRFAIWPRGAGQDPQDGRVVLLADGSRVGPDDMVSASAAVLPVSALAGVPDGYWGGRLSFCVPKATDVLVLDTVTVTG